MKTPKYYVRVYPLSLDQAYVSQVYAGLYDLAASGTIDLKFIWFPMVRIHQRKGSHHAPSNTTLMYLEINSKDVGICKVCYDLQDGTDISSLDGLENCDVYFKRSFSSDFIQSTSQIKTPELRCKIHPYGLNMPWRSYHSKNELKRALIFNIATGAYRRESRAAIKRVLKAATKGLKIFRSSSKSTYVTEKLECDPRSPVESLILFQTRLFDPALRGRRDPIQLLRMNKFRIETLKALKSAFGDIIIGGLIPNEYTLNMHPDVHHLISKEKTSRKEYLKLVKKCLITVFSLGVLDSNGWRLPEYFAMSKCIVSEHLKYELPEPIQENKHCIFFSNPSECVEACKLILDNPGFANEMRRKNYEYYIDNIDGPVKSHHSLSC